jgi:Family of unknown function (DUF5723)
MKIKSGLIFLFIVFNSYAQELQNSSASGYSGYNTVFLNPAFADSQFLNWDFTLVGANSFLENNYAYLKNGSIIGLLNNDAQFIKSDQSSTSQNYLGTFDSTPENKYLYTQHEVQGPSLLLKLKKFNIGFGMRLRTHVSSNNINENLVGSNFYFTENFDITRTTKPFNVVGAAWTEYSIHFSKKIKETAKKKIVFGINAKLLKAHEGLVFNNLGSNPITVNKEQVIAEVPDLRVRLATGVKSLNNNDEEGYDTTSRGTGLGIDLGISKETKSWKNFDNEKAYGERIGLSIMDLGFLNYSSQAYDYLFSVNSQSSFIFDELSTYDTITEKGSFISDQIYGDPNAAYKGDSFTILLPTVVSFQYSKRYTNHFLLDANVIQRIVLGNNAMKRTNSTSITPRLEHKWFEVGMPVSLLEYSKLRLGTFLRIGPILLGSDNILPLFVEQKKLYGYHFYFAFRIFPFSFKKAPDCVECVYE